MSKRRPSPTDPIVTTDGDKTIRHYGIYRHETEPAKHFTPATLTLANQGITLQILIPKSREELEADSQAWNAEPERTLGRIRESATRIYKRYAVEVVDQRNPPLSTSMQRHDLGDGLRTYQLTENAPPIAEDAAHVLIQCDAVETASDPNFRILEAIQLGRYYERMLVRQVASALHYLRKLDGEQRKGRKRRAKNEPVREQRRQAVYAAMTQQIRRREKLSFRRAMIAAASDCHCSFEAIRKAKPVNRWTARRKRKR